MEDISMLAEDTVRLITSIFDDITNPFVSTSETEYKSFINLNAHIDKLLKTAIK